ncbi:MAG: DUF5317 domain-containing protein [Firmicutes bacterium]|nr:DUF5317 domain-containing protein [Bacillota bacterium]
MIIAEAFIVSVAIALLRGGNLSRLAALKVNSLWLAFAPLVVQIAVFLFEPVRMTLRDAVPYIHVLTYVFSGAFIYLNLDIPGMKVMGLGTACNTLVITLNGGYMPASTSALAGAGMLPVLKALASGPHHNSVLIHQQTRLWFFGDIFFVPPPFPTPNVFSVGDVLIALGAFIFAQRTLRAAKRGPVAF